MNSDRYKVEEGSDGCCEKNRLSICLGVLLAVALVILGVFATNYMGVFRGSTKSACESSECIKSSSEILNFIDDSIDPCEDFHSFVCGNFIKTAYEKQVSSLLKVERDRIERQIDALVTEEIDDEDVEPIKMQKKYFLACMDEDAIDLDQERTFFRLMDKLSGWPLLNRRQWREREFHWMNVMVNAKRLGLPFNWFLDFDIHQNEENDYYTLKITRPSSCDLVENQKTDEYVNMMYSILPMLTEPSLNSAREIPTIVDFQKEFIDICTRSRQGEVTVNSVIDLENVWFKTGTSCLKFIREITGQGTKWQLNSQIAYDDFIIRLDHLLSKTPKRVQAAFILWKLIESLAPYLSKPVRETYKNYTEKITGEATSRFKFCLMDTKSRFQYVSETVNIRNYDGLIEDQENNLVTSVRQELVDQVEDIEWSNNETKYFNIEFLKDLEEVVGGVDEMFEDDVFSKYLLLGELSFSTSNIVNMTTEWSTSVFESKLKSIGNKAPGKNLASSYEANARHRVMLDIEGKQIFVPAAMFQGFPYNPDRPQYLNYAGLGTTIALEFSRGLLQFNKKFNVTYPSAENEKCLEQSFKTNNQDLDSAATLKVNYAWLIAQDVAYNAYQKWAEKNGEEELLVGLDYNQNQLFWIKSSLNWCYRSLPEEDNSILDLDEILKYRIIEGVQNSESFSADFGCPVRAKMNPEKKCGIL